MKKKTLNIMLTLYIGYCLVAGHPVIAQHNLASEQLRADFRLFRQALQEAHPGLYRYNTRESMDSLFRQTEMRLDRAMTQQEFYQVLVPVVAKIGCGHTKLHPDNNWTDNYYFSREKLFPYKLFLQDNRAWIVESYDGSGVEHKGLEVVSINGNPVPLIIDKLLSAFFSDGNNQTFKYIEMSRFFSAAYANLFNAPDTFRIHCKEGDKDLELIVAGIQKSVIDKYALRTETDPPYSLTFPDPHTALITLNSFWMEAPGLNYKRFLKQSFATINSRNTKHLIIDVRNNEGGMDKRGALLLSYLMDREFRYYDRLEATTNKKYSFAENARLPKFYGMIRLLVTKTESGQYRWKHNRNLKIQKPQKHPYTGEVYVLTNGASFSVTAEFAAVTHFLKRATFIGEETGGGYYGNNSGTFVIVTLPDSRLNLGIPMLAYYTAVSGYPYPDRGVIPDYTVKPTILDLLNGKDVVMEFTLDMVGKKNGN